MTSLIRGQKIKLSDLADLTQPVILEVQLDAPFSVDTASFGLDGQYRLSDERYMTFYNQPVTPCNAVRLVASEANTSRFQIELSKANPKIEHFVFTLAIDGQGTMAQLKQSKISLFNAQGKQIADFEVTGRIFQQERALMLLEIYRKDHIWRLAAVAQGFNEGLDALIRHFGGEVAEDNSSPTETKPSLPQSATPAPASTIDLKKKIALEKAEKTGSQAIVDLTKKSMIQLEKNNLLAVQARVALVLDASGSMDNQYKRGDVQKVVDRLMPLAINFDNDGSFECWAFAQKTTQLDDVTLNNASNFINTAQRGWRNWSVGARYNEEIPAIEAVIQYYSQFKDNLPVYVLFISDGGVGNAKQMQRILSNAAKLPLFWQFVGIGGRNYGVLEKLDDMTGRVVDNCNFFALDTITSIPDEKLYELLLEEFPDWLKQASLKNIIGPR